MRSGRGGYIQRDGHGKERGGMKKKGFISLD